MKRPAAQGSREPRPGGPRRAHDIFQAALDLLVERGYEGLAMEAVASRSGVNKTTLYRWWPSKDALLAAALTDSDALSLSVPDTGSLRGDLRALTGRIAELLTDPVTAPIAAALLSAGVERPELAALSRAFFGDRLVREQPVLERAAQRGDPVADVDLRTVMDLLAGAVWFRVFVRGGEAPTGAELDEIVRTVLRGVEGRAEPSS
ncbi:TetR/AcrR family transcriptional regulator [Isoptericola sp. F-RaC21]|uniref:TetR/AcrR family transcriptional regulator n=1 Tax=Isoptericola sp. F-RaC21 TaxID=3141452 RepID=UPI00315BFCBD